jgi:alpha-ketoglutarate-dependent taurine dioxygenase
MSMTSTINAQTGRGADTAPQFKPLSKHIGCEVTGIDLREPVPEAVASAIYRAWLDHAVLLFRDQDLTQEDLIRVTGIFGEFAPLGRPKHTLPKGFAKILPNIMLISNIRENGETIGALPDGEMMFHHDTFIATSRTRRRCSIRWRFRPTAATRCLPAAPRPTTPSTRR